MCLNNDQLETIIESLQERVTILEQMIQRLRKANIVSYDLSLDFWKILTPDQNPANDEQGERKDDSV